MNDKVDFLDFQKKFQEQYGIIDQDMAKIRKIHILTFRTAEDGRILSRLSTGGIVFRHKETGMNINSGETWVCEVIERNTTFFATGLLKLDAKFFFDLRSDQVEELASIVWEKNRSILEPRFEEMYLAQMREKLDEKLSESKKREEEANSRVEELKREIEALNIKNKMVIAAMESELAALKEKKTTETHAPPSESQVNIEERYFANVHPKIRRIGPDEIFSEDFRHRNYFVHISADQSAMTIRPHDQGTVVCVDKKITLNGLGIISPYSGPTDMPAEYNPKYGAYLVMIKYSASIISGDI